MTEVHHTSTPSRENALALIKELRDRYEDRVERLHEANEAKTRLLVIDRVLQTLGWASEDLNPEEPAGQLGYIDYLLTTDDGIPRLVVEAKRANYTFSLTRRNMNRNHYQLRYFRSAFGPAFTEVLEQAERYAREREVPFAVLTNGSEWVLVQLRLVPGYGSIDDLRGIYFGNLLSDGFNLDLFWQLLYRPYVEEGSLEEHFAQLNLKEVDYSMIPRSQVGDLHWKKAANAHTLGDFYYHFLGEITDPGRRRMLEKCFVSNTRLDHYQGELKRTIKDTAPGYVAGAIEISPAEREKLFSAETGDQKGRVVLVTGSVGCGKSTLIHKVIVEQRQEPASDLVFLIIDLIDEVTEEYVSVVPTLWRYLVEEWKKVAPESYHYGQLQKIFGKELSDLRRGPRANQFDKDEQLFARHEADLLDALSQDPEEFFPKVWRYYRQKRQGIVVFFDNVDRASEAYQRQVYGFAHKLARRTGATVIITMREFTFFRGQEAGFLDVRASDMIFHLQTPNLEQLLSKRISYVEQSLDDDHRLSKWRRSGNWPAFHDAALKYAATLKRTFLTSESGREILSLLAAVAWHDVRYFLSTLRRVHSMLGDEYGAWAVPETLAALMTSADGGTVFPILSNIYRPPYPNYRCYYLKIRILMMMVYGQQAHEMRGGTSLQKTLRFARLYGYQDNWTKRAVGEMVQERFLECLEAPTEEEYTKKYEVVETHSFRPSPLSIVLVERILSEPVYLCLIGNSLPFHTQLAFDRYGSALTEVLKVMDEQQLERSAVGLLSETALGQIVARYLVDAYNDEQPAENLLANVPEIAATERVLSEVVNRLRKHAKVAAPSKLKNSVSRQQLPLFGQSPHMDERSPEPIIIPQNLSEIRINGSEYPPLIFCALVALDARGKLPASGTEIAQIINEHFVDEHNKKAPNNVSRALRGSTLQSQPWLVTINVSARKRVFELSPKWESFWEGIFDEPAPNVSR